jgi:transcription termination factor Rho
MTKAELEKKHLSELHSLAAEAGVERYRMLSRAELVAKLADGEGRQGKGSAAAGGRTAEKSGSGQGERPPRRRRRRSGKAEPGGERRSRAQAKEPEPAEEPAPTPPARPPAPEPSAPEPSSPAPSAEASRPRRRRRRRFGRRGKQEVTLQGLLLPPAGRQALLAAESREGCTVLLRGIAADLSGAKGPDPVVLLIDPSPEELAEWRRDAPQAEIVAAGQPRHADDALAQAQARASGGEDVILLIDSLTRLGEAHGDADAARAFFDAAGGSLTVVAALERS